MIRALRPRPSKRCPLPTQGAGWGWKKLARDFLEVCDWEVTGGKLDCEEMPYVRFLKRVKPVCLRARYI